MRTSWLLLALCACGGPAMQDAGTMLEADAGSTVDAGVHVDAGTTVDAGSAVDAGPCTPGSCVGVGPSVNTWTCNPATRSCGNRPLCIGSQTCVYGLVCEFAECSEAIVTGIGCANFANLPQVTSWNPATVMPQGPITRWLLGGPKDNELPLACRTRGADFTANVGLMDTPMLPSMLELVPGGVLSYVGPDGGVVDVRTLARPSRYQRSTGTDGLPVVTLSFNLCVDNPPTLWMTGFFAQNGNPVCSPIR